MDIKTCQVSVIIPAYNEELIVGEHILGIGKVLEDTGNSYEILVIDDGSTDNTAEEAEAAGGKVIRHPYNIGNGAAIKTGIRNAKGEFLVMLDADGQHPPEEIPSLLDKLKKFDMVVGERESGSETEWHRDFANKVYNILASYVCGFKVKDLTSGFRALKTGVARNYVYLLPNHFSYPTTLTLAILRSGRSLTYVPFKGRRRIGKSKIRIFKDGLKFLLIILRIATFYAPLKVFIPVSLSMFFTGFSYGLIKVLFFDMRYGPTSAMIMTVSILVFMVGLISEQITQLRFERSESFEE